MIDRQRVRTAMTLLSLIVAITPGAVAVTVPHASAWTSEEVVTIEGDATASGADDLANGVRSVMLVVVPVLFLGLAAAALVIRSQRGGDRFLAQDD